MFRVSRGEKAELTPGFRFPVRIKALCPPFPCPGGGVLSDIFGDYARNIYAKAGYTTLMVADDRAYHNSYGSIHCATNVIRATPSSYNWWEN